MRETLKITKRLMDKFKVLIDVYNQLMLLSESIIHIQVFLEIIRGEEKRQ